MKKWLKIAIEILLFLIIIVFLLRLTTPREIDDISPGIYCEESYLEKSDILWVIPKFNGTAISENQTWCKKILQMNKTIGIHGFEHYYHEWGDEKNQAHLDEIKEIFNDCFNFTPTAFKAPNLALTKENKILLEENNFTIRTPFDQTIHKVYHCNDSGILPNWLHNLI